MSDYVHALKRLDTDRRDTAVAAPPAVGAKRPHLHRAPHSDSPGAQDTASIAPETAAAFAALFDNLRALANGQPTRNLVFAPASAAESVRAVTAGLVGQLERRGLHALVAELTESAGRSLLTRRSGEWDAAAGIADRLAFDLHGPTWATEFADWLAVATRRAAAVVIEGLPLAHSIDSAVLARACDGLVIVAQPEVTHREALQVAAERARLVGCRTLGVVMHAARDPLPRWIRRLVDGGRRRPAEAL